MRRVRREEFEVRKEEGVSREAWGVGREVRDMHEVRDA